MITLAHKSHHGVYISLLYHLVIRAPVPQFHFLLLSAYDHLLVLILAVSSESEIQQTIHYYYRYVRLHQSQQSNSLTEKYLPPTTHDVSLNQQCESLRTLCSTSILFTSCFICFLSAYLTPGCISVPFTIFHTPSLMSAILQCTFQVG